MSKLLKSLEAEAEAKPHTTYGRRRLMATRPIGGRKNQMEVLKDGKKHKLDLSEIDELDEISGDEQLALVWCDTHRKYEWHWLPRER